jgi:uncharacterized protein
MLFVIAAFDKPDSLELRTATRPAHVDYLQKTGVVKLGGPFLDDKGEMIGSLLIIEAPDIASARDWQANDPYVKAGLFAHADLRPWKATANFCKAEL